MLDWLGTEEFRQLFQVYEEATGPHRLYYRLTADGIIPMVLVDHAPGYVGFGDEPTFDTKWHPGKIPPALEDVQMHWQVFNDEYLPSVRRISLEEQGVIPWIRDGLEHDLRLSGMPAMGNREWLFLNQEWRLPSGNKTDVIAVHLPTGRLGFVEFKDMDTPKKRADARRQLATYQTYWQNHREVLIPFFRTMLRAYGSLYGNNEAAVAVISNADARLFFGVAHPAQVVYIEEIQLP